jgi:peptidoglycan/LPS O-acetylase OafA/YrhL
VLITYLKTLGVRRFRPASAVTLQRSLSCFNKMRLVNFSFASDHVQELLGQRLLTQDCLGFGDNWFFAAMPVVRTFFTGGHFAVSVFFVISGYVLSAKPLSLINSGETVKLGDNLASALFRRWLRLYIPVFVTAWMYLTSWHLFGIWTVSPNHEANYRDELWKFYVEFKNYSFAFRTGGEDWLSYNFPTWSIPVEFRGSIIIYTTLLAFSRCSKNMRLFGMVGLIFYFMYIVDGWFGSLFMAGTYFATTPIQFAY